MACQFDSGPKLARSRIKPEIGVCLINGYGVASTLLAMALRRSSIRGAVVCGVGLPAIEQVGLPKSFEIGRRPMHRHVLRFYIAGMEITAFALFIVGVSFATWKAVRSFAPTSQPQRRYLRCYWLFSAAACWLSIGGVLAFEGSSASVDDLGVVHENYQPLTLSLISGLIGFLMTAAGAVVLTWLAVWRFLARVRKPQ